MEYISGGQLKRLFDQQQLQESEVRHIMKSILEGVNYLHEHDYMHRDLKSENILIQESDQGLISAKIIDFGLSTKHKVLKFEEIDERIGTLIYMAPEQAQSQSYGKRVDIWSCGMLMYQLLNKGEHPLYQYGMNREQFMTKIKGISNFENIKFPLQISRYIYQSIIFAFSLAKDLFCKLCTVSPSQRYDAKKALQHPWITGDINSQIPLTQKQKLQNYDCEESLRKVQRALLFIASLKKDQHSQDSENGFDLQQYKRVILDQSSFEKQSLQPCESLSTIDVDLKNQSSQSILQTGRDSLSTADEKQISIADIEQSQNLFIKTREEGSFKQNFLLTQQIKKRQQSSNKKNRQQYIKQNIMIHQLGVEQELVIPKDSQIISDISPLMQIDKNLLFGRNTPVLKKTSIKYNQNSNVKIHLTKHSKTSHKNYPDTPVEESEPVRLNFNQKQGFQFLLQSKTPNMKKLKENIFHKTSQLKFRQGTQALTTKHFIKNQSKIKQDYLDCVDYPLKTPINKLLSSLQQEPLSQNSNKLDFSIRKLKTRKFTDEKQVKDQELNQDSESQTSSFFPNFNQNKYFMSSFKNSGRKMSVKNEIPSKFLHDFLQHGQDYLDNFIDKEKVKRQNKLRNSTQQSDINELTQQVYNRVQSQTRQSVKGLNEQSLKQNGFISNNQQSSNHSSYQKLRQNQLIQNGNFNHQPLTYSSPIMYLRNQTKQNQNNDYQTFTGLSSIESKIRLENIYKMQEIAQGFPQTNAYSQLAGTLNIKGINKSHQKQGRYQNQAKSHQTSTFMNC
eukprot:403330751